MQTDLIGIGFGPANLAVAIALIEKWEDAKASGGRVPVQSACFIEKHDRFAWHPGMLLPGTRMQVSFLKDLATLRNPSSPFTFLRYLHEHDRLVSFINRGSSAPTRREFADYLTWASKKVAEHEAITVVFGEEVVSIESDKTGELVTLVSHSSSGETIVRTGKNLIISPGGQANIPTQIIPIFPHPQIVHTSDYANAISKILEHLKAPSAALQDPIRIAVIGGGQSSAEVYLDLASRLQAIPKPNNKRHQLDMIFRRGSLKPADDSPFANEIFDPVATDFIYSLSGEARRTVREEYANANYSVVSPSTLQTVYEVVYDQKVENGLARRDPSLATEDDSSKPILNLLPYYTILSAAITSSCSSACEQFTLGLHHALKNSFDEATYDVIILGTGYDRESASRLLGQSETIASQFGLDKPIPQAAGYPKAGKLQLSRNYRLLPKNGTEADIKFKPAVYIQGSSELSHGLSDTLLSVVSVRSSEIVGDLLKAAEAREAAA